ncbi:hypothetical protein VDGL01_05239, partial [Verticillium dahliae]
KGGRSTVPVNEETEQRDVERPHLHPGKQELPGHHKRGPAYRTYQPTCACPAILADSLPASNHDEAAPSPGACLDSFCPFWQSPPAAASNAHPPHAAWAAAASCRQYTHPPLPWTPPQTMPPQSTSRLLHGLMPQCLVQDSLGEAPYCSSNELRAAAGPADRLLPSPSNATFTDHVPKTVVWPRYRATDQLGAHT